MILSLILLVVLQQLAQGAYKGEEDVLFSFKYDHAEWPEGKLPPSEDFLPIRTQDNEQYYCQVPSEIKNVRAQDNKLANYQGPNEWDLLRPVFESKRCSIRLEPYWAYELCHMKTIKQFHGAPEDPTRKEFHLGKYIPYANQLPARENGHQSITLEGQDYPYFQLNYTMGEVCDLTGERRSTQVLYICNEMSNADIYQISEVESCKYQIIVLTKLLCSHPKYHIRTNYINDLTCFKEHSLNAEDPRPRALVKFEKSRPDLNQFSSIEALFDSPELKNVKFEAKREKNSIVYRLHVPQKPGEEDSPTDREDAFESIRNQLEKELIENEGNEIALETAKKSLVDLMSLGDNLSKQQALDEEAQLGKPLPVTTFQSMSAIQRKDFIDFLRAIPGKCIVSGAGWWRQLICFRDSIMQIHEDHQQPQHNARISLGKFNEQLHMQEYERDIKIRQNTPQTIFYYYLNGDICSNGHPRRTVLQLTCDPAATLLSQTFVEDPVCHYHIHMKWDALCPILMRADLTNGRLPENLHNLF